MDDVEHRVAVHAHQRGVAERVAQRGHLPVQHGEHLGGVLRVEHRVVDAVVAVHDRGAALRRNRFCQSRMQPLDVGVRWIVLPPDQLPLPAPTPHLALEIAGGLAEVAEPDRLRIDRVQVGQHLDQRVDAVADRAPCRRAPRVRRRAARHGPPRTPPSETARRSTESSLRIVTARATGTGVSCSAATTRYSRAMSCADGVSPCSGGLRSTHFDASSKTRNVRLDRPPEISSARSSPVRGMPTDRRWRSRASRSSPSSEVVTGLVYHR